MDSEEIRPVPVTELAPEEIAHVRKQLRGIRSVELRQFGADDGTGAALAEFLRREGLDTTVTRIERMVPKPLRRIAIRYQGSRAEITVAPEVRSARIQDGPLAG